MADSSSGFPLPSRDAQELYSASPSKVLSDQDNGPRSKASLALAVLSEKIKSGALQTSEVMERIVAQGLAATGAKGIAVALRENAGAPVVCCASAGQMAPPPGTVLDESSGFTAECLRNGVLMICEDSQTDDRVDSVVCSRLGIRSIVAAPVEHEGATIGVLEALSDQVAAFTKQHIEVLLSLACFAKSGVAAAGEPRSAVPVLQPAAPPVSPNPAAVLQEPAREWDVLDQIAESRNWSERVPARIRLALAGAVAAAFVLALCATAVFLWMWRENAAAGVSKKTQPSAQPVAIAKPSAAVGARSSGTGVAPVQRVFRGDHKNAIKPLLEKAIAVEKIPAAESPVSEASGESPAVVDPPSITASLPKKDVGVLSGILNAPENLASPALATSEGVTPARLEHRVEPIYPGDAKRLHIEGPVVLRATIDEKGSIQSLDVVKGSPLLAKAAVEAVRKWRYRPSELNHRFVPSTTDITVVFHLK